MQPSACQRASRLCFLLKARFCSAFICSCCFARLITAFTCSDPITAFTRPKSAATILSFRFSSKTTSNLFVNRSFPLPVIRHLQPCELIWNMQIRRINKTHDLYDFLYQRFRFLLPIRLCRFHNRRFWKRLLRVCGKICRQLLHVLYHWDCVSGICPPVSAPSLLPAGITVNLPARNESHH